VALKKLGELAGGLARALKNAALKKQHNYSEL
jgi:hypothetical protein